MNFIMQAQQIGQVAKDLSANDTKITYVFIIGMFLFAFALIAAAVKLVPEWLKIVNDGKEKRQETYVKSFEMMFGQNGQKLDQMHCDIKQNADNIKTLNENLTDHHQRMSDKITHETEETRNEFKRFAYSSSKASP